MDDLAVEQISHRGKPNMRMRPYVDADACFEDGGADMVEENKRPNHARLRRRQRAMDLKAAEIDRTRHHDMGDCVARLGIAEERIFGGKKAHGGGTPVRQIRCWMFV